MPRFDPTPSGAARAVGLRVVIRSATLVLLATLLPAQESDGFILGPRDGVYPDYLADPRRPQFTTAQMLAFDSELEEQFDSGSPRVALALGERLRFVRWPSPADPELGWQLDLDAVIFSQFDQTKSLDNIGWDGVYALRLGWRFDQQWALGFAFRHLSAHIGDEFELETGRGRIDYTREDLALGLSWMPDEAVTVYTEWGWAPDPDDTVEHWVAQFGAQYQNLEPALGGRFGWYLGLDIKTFQENDWSPDVTLRAALVAPTANPGRGLELGLALYHGRAILGEFSVLDEDYLTLFVTYDL